MTVKRKISVAAILLLASNVAACAQNKTAAIPAAQPINPQTYINNSYPQYQNGDQNYKLPNQHSGQYYGQEPEPAIGQHGTKRAAQNEGYQQQYYYY